MVIYSSQTIMVSSPYDKIEKSVRLISRDLEGSSSSSFCLDLLF